MPVSYPVPLHPGDRIAVTAPSSGVPEELMPRLEFCVDSLRQRGYEVVVGQCLQGDGATSASPERRATELMQMLTEPGVRAIVPPWGGDLAVEVLHHLDFDAVRRAEPTWLVGFSDTSTLLLALSTCTGVATLHGQNLMDTPYLVPAPLLSWLDVASAPAGSVLRQGSSAMHRARGHDLWENDPTVTEYTFDTPGSWRLLDGNAGEVRVRGRLMGGCIECVSTLAGTALGDVAGFAATHAPEGLLIYLEASEEGALSIARHLWRMRLAGWFDAANGVLMGRTNAPDDSGFTQEDAVRSALAELDIPVVMDVDCGHLPPHLALVNGAVGEVVLSDTARATLTQRLDG